MPSCSIRILPSSIVAPGNLSSSILELSDFTMVILLPCANAMEVKKIKTINIIFDFNN